MGQTVVRGRANPPPAAGSLVKARWIGAVICTATSGPVSARLTAKEAGLVGVLALWWSNRKWQLAGTMPLLRDTCSGGSRLFIPTTEEQPTAFAAGTPLVFEYLNLNNNSVFDSIQTGVPHPIRLHAPRGNERRCHAVIESSRAAVLSFPNNTAQIGFIARIGDPTPSRFTNYPIRIDVTNVARLP
jgi:hypothetical protein